MPNESPQPGPLCPSCEATLDAEARRLGVCNCCGRAFDAGELLAEQLLHSHFETTRRDTIRHKWLWAGLGALLLVVGAGLGWWSNSAERFAALPRFPFPVRWAFWVPALVILAIWRAAVTGTLHLVVLLVGGVVFVVGVILWGLG